MRVFARLTGPCVDLLVQEQPPLWPSRGLCWETTHNPGRWFVSLASSSPHSSGPHHSTPGSTYHGRLICGTFPLLFPNLSILRWFRWHYWKPSSPPVHPRPNRLSLPASPPNCSGTRPAESSAQKAARVRVHLLSRGL